MIKKMLYDRKGVAIELAILMTMVCLAVTTIVLSAALLQYENKVQAQQRMEENIIFEQIVEAWLKAEDMKEPVEDYPGYFGMVEINGGGQITGFGIYLKDEKGGPIGEPLLTIKVEIENGVITKWTKG